MIRVLMIGFLISLSLQAVGQINMEDSTVQVVGYWDNKEKQSYTVSIEKYKVKDSDTTSREFTRCDVDVTVTDSTADSYTIEWLYKNYEVKTDNKLTQKLASISQNMKVIIKTNELGTFIEVLNWQEIRDFIKKGADLLRSEFKTTPKINEIIDQVVAMTSSKEAIESLAIKEIQQFYSFHGGKYKLDEETGGNLKIPNIFGGEPLDSEVTVRLTEINEEGGNSIIRMWQTVDPKQATDASYAFIKKMAESMGTKVPEREKIPTVTIEDQTAARIHGPSGWIIYSVNTKEVSADNLLKVEQTVIELKD